MGDSSLLKNSCDFNRVLYMRGPKLQKFHNKKIKNIQKIIRDKDKSKPRLNMITKRPS